MKLLQSIIFPWSLYYQYYKSAIYWLIHKYCVSFYQKLFNDFCIIYYNLSSELDLIKKKKNNKFSNQISFTKSYFAKDIYIHTFGTVYLELNVLSHGYNLTKQICSLLISFNFNRAISIFYWNWRQSSVRRCTFRPNCNII